jgi:hypothetical protein
VPVDSDRKETLEEALARMAEERARRKRQGAKLGEPTKTESRITQENDKAPPPGRTWWVRDGL